MSGSPAVSDRHPATTPGVGAGAGPDPILPASSTVAGRLRSLIRAREVALVPLAVAVGLAAGLAVAALSWAAQRAHVVLFGLPLDVRLSATAVVDPVAAMAAPVAGGVLLSLIEMLRRRCNLGRAADPVEANALRGGDLSLRESLVVSLQTLVSNGCGASVGLEAAYAQIGAGLASRAARTLRLRRNDRRLLLGCGVAAAIGAAFSAPLAGALYACELVIGAYSVRSAGPVFAAALAGSMLTNRLGGNPYALHAAPADGAGSLQVVALAGLGLATAVFGIGVMRAATVAEAALKRRFPATVRPMLGGAFVGALAAACTPQVLAAGHGALALDLGLNVGAAALAVLILLKCVACIASLASGFRGGLFFASLFLGALLGKLYAALFAAPWLTAGVALDPVACALAGMAGLATAIVGAPLTMVFLVLEMTRSFAVAAVTLPVCMISSTLVRSLFGHSFSTWRLHLQGETIRSPEDVGWLRELTVQSMMRRDVASIRADATVAECRRAFHLGSHPAVFLVGPTGAYCGLALLPDIFDPRFDGEMEAQPVLAAARFTDTALTSGMNVAAAMRLFETVEADVLAVVDSSRRVVGFVTEAFARRRYMQALEAATETFGDPG